MPRQDWRRVRRCSGKEEPGRCVARVGTGLEAIGCLILRPSMPQDHPQGCHGQLQYYDN